MLRTASLVIDGAIVAGAALLAHADELTPQLSAVFKEKLEAVMLNGAAQKPVAHWPGWGAVVGVCGMRVLATSDRDSASPDTLRLFDLAGGKPTPASQPLDTSGPITALWPSPPGATMVVKESPSRYVAYDVAVDCAQ